MERSQSAIFIFYWALWIALPLPPVLIRLEGRKLERWETLAAHPDHARVLRWRRAIWNGYGLLAVGGLAFVRYSNRVAMPRVPRLAGLSCGTFLLLDALLAWRSGIRRASSFRTRFTIEEPRGWQAKLQLALAAADLLVPISSLLS